jgi:hypothetical protein
MLVIVTLVMLIGRGTVLTIPDRIEYLTHPVSGELVLVETCFRVVVTGKGAGSRTIDVRFLDGCPPWRNPAVVLRHGLTLNAREYVRWRWITRLVPPACERDL